MPEAFIIEVNDEHAGVVLRVGRDFQFYASSPRFFSLEGKRFSSPFRAEAAARKLRPARVRSA